ncbi:ABC transporter ATP-binding protein [Granulosicoccus sp. 3-233]|uniref:ABC transporter ATP-binding protein n=1 Tax=Granulosicoccus sp. 3-233 TaxID=3417969 RepID=UPI003D34ED67
MPNLQLDNIIKNYGDHQAVKGISIDVPAGEFLVLVGASGCGKSTLLRCIAGLEDISQGTITLGGRAFNGLAPRERNIAMVFQSYALYPYLSVYENIAFGLRARKFAEPELDRQVHWAADLLDITRLLQNTPRELSGGERQRVAIGRAIVRDADLYLFDEPLSNLDAKLRDGMREEIKRLHERLGKTFIYVTHDQIEAMTLAERIVLLRDGRIEQAGAPLALFERPINQYVAGFLGSPPMNFIEVTIASGTMTLPDGQQLSIQTDVADGSYHWGVRPEHWSHVDSGFDTLQISLEVVQPTGSRSYGTFHLAGTHVVAELEARALQWSGKRIALTVDMASTALFDTQSGDRVG